MRRIKALLALSLVLILGVSGLSASPAVAAGSDEDISVIIDRLQDYYLAQGDEIIIANGIYLARTSEALDYVESQEPDGSWDDVDYADRTSSANGATWSAYIALYRMVAMAHAYRDPTAPGFEDPALVEALDRALLYWDEADPGNANWWETEIGESIAMGRVSILLRDELSDAALQVSLEHNTGKLDPVGANGAWRTSNYIFEGLATGDLDRVTDGFSTIVETIAVDPSGEVNEAVQPDGSFWAHGAQLYSEGYGMVLFTYAALWADAARGTGLAFTRDQLDSIAFYIVNGTRWMIRGEIGMLYLNYRPPKTIQGVTSHASEFIEPLQWMVRTDPLYATSYEAMLDGILGETRTNGASGNKYFWRSEFSSHIRDEYGIFTRLNSSRTFGAELRTAYRDELGNPVYWNAMGSTAIQVNNREYLDLGPTFDWVHYPGVTAPDEKRTERGVANRGRNGDGASFTGGVSNGEYGASVLTLDTARTEARKSYFAFDDQVVALGTDISSDSDAAVHTTINQVVAKDNASVGGESVAPGTAFDSVGDARWAYNDEVGYVFAEGQDVRVSNRTQTGSWIDEDPVDRDAFMLHIDHGEKPTSGSYEYTVLPAAEPEQVEAYVAAPGVRTLSNDSDVQAVRHDDLALTMATFYGAGSVDLGGGRALTVDEPALVLVDESGARPVVSVANPDRPGLSVSVSLEGAGDDWSGVFGLGSGANVGKTVTAPLVEDAPAEASDHSASTTADGSSVQALGDGDRDTVWSAGAPAPAWVATRLERGSWVTKVTIDWADAFATDFLVQTSNDGEEWTDHARVSDAEGGTSEVEITPTPAEHVRVVMLDGEQEDVAVRELRVDSGVNLAIDAETRASGYAGYNLVHLMNDGDGETRWRGNNSDSAWAQVDLGSSQPVSTVRLHWEAAFAKAYRIQLSDDGASWRDAYTTPSGGSDGGTDVIDLGDESARFVRMQTDMRALNYGPSLWEFEVFADSSVADAPVIAAEQDNLALGKPTTADSVHNDNATIVASKATDGSESTKWSSARAREEHWIQVDLERVQPISRAIVRWEAGTSNEYRIEGSVDGETWSPIVEVDETQSSLTHVHDFAFTEVRYVRLTGMPATQYGLNIWELELYGYTLDCEGAVEAGRDGSATVAATLAPADAETSFSVASMDESVVTIAGEARVDADGRVEADLDTHEPGATQVLLHHSRGDEVASCDVVVSADTARIDELVERANGLDSTLYTSDSWRPVLPALEAAKIVLATPGAAQQSVDDAAERLAAALDGLAKRDDEPGAEAPSAPRDVTASATAGAVHVEWSAPEDDGGATVTAYEVTAGDRVVEVDGGVLSADAAGFEPGTYAVSVRARNAAGWSDPSEEVTVDVSEDGQVAPTITVKGSLRVGGAIVVTGAGFEPDTEYTLELRSTPQRLGAVATDGEGRFALSTTIADGAEPGEHTIVAILDGEDIASARIQIAAAQPGDGSGDGDGGDAGGDGWLPSTGGDTAWVPWAVGGAVLLLLAGTAAMLIRRRRATD